MSERHHNAFLGVVILVVLLAGCMRPYQLGSPVYSRDEWTIRLADQASQDGGCVGGFENKRVVLETDMNFSVRSDASSCTRIEAARKATLGGAFNVSIDGSNASFWLQLDDRARQHTDGWSGVTPSTNWVAMRPGQLILLVAEPIRPAPSGSWLQVEWEPTTTDDPSEVREP